MSNVYIEKRDDGYVAIQNKQVITKGNTQASTADNAHRMSPDASILAARVRLTGEGSPDKWRRIR